MRACAVCQRPCAGSRCPEHSLRGSWASPLYQRNRRVVLAGATVCEACGGRLTADDPGTAGHIVALAEGGTDELSNLRPEHESCNKRAGRAMQERAPVWRPLPVTSVGPRLFA